MINRLKIADLTSSLDRNRTCIWSFGNSYTIHCTTRPNEIRTTFYPNLYLKLRLAQGEIILSPSERRSAGRALCDEAK